MGVLFRSLRSSSSGNCLMLWTEKTMILIDCGFKTQRECEASLHEHTGGNGRLDAVIVSHAHSDHIGYSSLRCLGRRGVRIHCHQEVARMIRGLHPADGWDARPEIHHFPHGVLEIGDLAISPMEVPHAPGFANFGFVIQCAAGRARRKIVICTDFHNYASVLDHFVDADFIFVEANHDLELLRRHPNYASQFHLSNPKTAWLLYHAHRRSDVVPQTVMLGHLSLQRNTEELAMGAVREVFERQGEKMGFELLAAPRYEPSEIVQIG